MDASVSGNFRSEEIISKINDYNVHYIACSYINIKYFIGLRIIALIYSLIVLTWSIILFPLPNEFLRFLTHWGIILSVIYNILNVIITSFFLKKYQFIKDKNLKFLFQLSFLYIYPYYNCFVSKKKIKFCVI